MSISVTPTNKTVGEGATAIFTATASGISKETFKYQWRKRDNNSLPSKVSGVNGIKLIIPNSLKTDEGQYYCNVTNEWGRSMKSNDVTLSVMGKWLEFVVEKLYVLAIIATSHYSWSTSD